MQVNVWPTQKRLTFKVLPTNQNTERCLLDEWWSSGTKTVNPFAIEVVLLDNSSYMGDMNHVSNPERNLTTTADLFLICYF